MVRDAERGIYNTTNEDCSSSLELEEQQQQQHEEETGSQTKMTHSSSMNREQSNLRRASSCQEDHATTSMNDTNTSSPPPPTATTTSTHPKVEEEGKKDLAPKNSSLRWGLHKSLPLRRRGVVSENTIGTSGRMNRDYIEERTQESTGATSSRSSLPSTMSFLRENQPRSITATDDISLLTLNNQLLRPSETNTNHSLPSILDNHRHLNAFASEANRQLSLQEQISRQISSHDNFYSNIQRQSYGLHGSRGANQHFIDWTRASTSTQQQLYNTPSTTVSLNLIDNLHHQRGHPYTIPHISNNIIQPSRANDHFIHTSHHAPTFRYGDGAGIGDFRRQLELHSFISRDNGIRGMKRPRQEDSPYTTTSHEVGPSSTGMISDTQRGEEQRTLNERKEGASEYEEGTIRSGRKRNFSQTVERQLDRESGETGLSSALFGANTEASAIHSLISRNDREFLPEMTTLYSPFTNASLSGGSPLLRNSIYPPPLQNYGVYSQNNTERQEENLLQNYSRYIGSIFSATEREIQNSLLSSVVNNSTVHSNIDSTSTLMHCAENENQGSKIDQAESSTTLTNFATKRLNDEEEQVLLLEGKAFQIKTVPGTGRRFLPLGIEEQDNSRLSKFLCFLRLECIEIFTATDEIVLQRMSSKKVTADQVGIRCIFCAHLPPKKKAGRSSNFPSSIARFYQGVSMMIYSHFGRCNEIPEDMKERYEELQKSTKKGDTESRSYWIESAKMKGLVDCGKGQGIRMKSETKKILSQL